MKDEFKKRAEEILIAQTGLCNCDIAFSARGKEDPSCPWHMAGGDSLIADIAQALEQVRNETIATIQKKVDEQSEDLGLWMMPMDHGAARYIQNGLRELHEVIEGVTK